ncbi:MAG: hypothetical protein ACPG6V_13085, partial [Flavobacteriales bacterium]
MNELKWISNIKFDDVLLIIQGAFLGWITNPMIAAYFTYNVKNEIDLVILFNCKPTKIDIRIIESEILPYLEDNILEYGINNINIQQLTITSSINEFKEKEDKWMRE